MSTLRVFTFVPDWGLPTTGPFALKLLAWLCLNRIPYEQVVEPNASKGPLGKSPWIEHEGRRIGDSDVIIAYLADRFGKPVDTPAPDPQVRAAAHVFKVAFEEQFHQVLEWELFYHQQGRAYIASQVRKMAPPLIAGLVYHSLTRHFHRQLHARGIARHSPEVIFDKARADIDALADYLKGRAFLAGDAPGLADLAVFGQVAPMLHWPMQTPVAQYLRSVQPVADWCERIKVRCFQFNSARVRESA